MHREAKDAVEAYPHKFNVIGVEPTLKVDTSLCKNHLQLIVDDLDTDVELYPQYHYAHKEDIMKAVDFGKKHKVHIIHCAAGLSRSPAIAYAIFRSQGMSKKEAMDKVLEIQPEAIPNKRIVKLTDEIFGK